MTGRDWRASVIAAPSGIDGALVVAWSGEDAGFRRARQADLALGVIILSIVGAFAAAVAVAMREAPTPEPRAPSIHAEARVLAAVVKELANPVAATAAAAQLLASEPGRSRVADMMQRAAMRVQRAFRRVARLARAGEEVVRSRVDLAAITQREIEALRRESEQSGHRLVYDGPDEGVLIRADQDDAALLVQSLIDAARALASTETEVRISVQSSGDERILVVSDRGPMKAAEREDATALEQASRTSVASPTLALTLASRICDDHRARFELIDRDGAEAGVNAVVTFGGDSRHSTRPPAP
jgi:signal transduction histidine kinase